MVLALRVLVALACAVVSAKQPSSDTAVIVTTAQQLFEAVGNASRHVHVTAHLDLRNHAGAMSDFTALINIGDSLMSLTVCNFASLVLCTLADNFGLHLRHS